MVAGKLSKENAGEDCGISISNSSEFFPETSRDICRIFETSKSECEISKRIGALIHKNVCSAFVCFLVWDCILVCESFNL